MIDEVDLTLRLDGLRSSVHTAIEQLAAGDIAGAQVTLGHAENVERQADVDADLELLADSFSIRSRACPHCGGSRVQCCEFGAER